MVSCLLLVRITWCRTPYDGTDQPFALMPSPLAGATTPAGCRRSRPGPGGSPAPSSGRRPAAPARRTGVRRGPRSWPTPVTTWGRKVSSAAPINAPSRLPRPPSTTAVTRVSESVSVKPLGAVIRTAIAISAPARPAQPALTTNASTRARPRSMPGDLRRDVVVAHRPPRAADPASREVREQHEGDDQREPADVGDVLAARDVVGGDEEDDVGEPVGDVGDEHVEALLPAEGVLEEQRDPGHRDRERQGGTGEVGAVQPRGCDADRGTDDQRDERRRREDTDHGQQRLAVLESSAAV